MKALFLDFDSTLSKPQFLERLGVWAIADKPDVLNSLTPEERIANFGGADRIAALDSLLSAVGSSTELYIESLGFKHAIIPQLETASLMRHFEPDNIYGQDELRSVKYVKAKLIASIVASHQWADALFVDDSKDHIAVANKRRVCRTLHVQGNGLSLDEMDDIRAWAAS
mgnify:CR=1 FL=1